MEILEEKKEKYQELLKKNNDFYGRGIIKYAEAFALLLEKAISESEEPAEIVIENKAQQLSHDADKEGITGFMYGMAIGMLSEYWKYGEDLRKWHNKKYDHSGDGVVNPAVLVVSRKGGE